MAKGNPKAEHAQRKDFEKWIQPLEELPELAVVGRAWSRNGSNFPQQKHAALEICYIERGDEKWWVNDEIHRLRGGDMLVFWPNETHGAVNDTLRPCTQYWIQIVFPARVSDSWLGLAARDAKHIHQGLKTLPRRRFSASKTVAQLWNGIFQALDRHDDLSTATVRANLTSLLLETITSSRRAALNQVVSSSVRHAIRIMKENLAYPLPIPVVAEMVGSSTSQLKRQFRLATGVPPAEYYLRVRVAAARQRIISSGEALTDIALNNGFSSSQYLSTCFKRILGCAPSALRRRNSNPKLTARRV
jgi:AraC-like DNA-binding protein/quercetin dioxygenase-like cupin family protein